MKKSEKALTGRGDALGGEAGGLLRLSRRVPAWVPTAVVLLVIGWFTLAPRPVGDIEPPLFEGADKLAHACLFGMLTLCIIRDAVRGLRLRRVSLSLAALAATVATLVGVGIEYAQKYMDLGRSFEPADMAADFAGAVAAAAAVLLFRRFSKRRRSHKP